MSGHDKLIDDLNNGNVAIHLELIYGIPRDFIQSLLKPDDNTIIDEREVLNQRLQTLHLTIRDLQTNLAYLHRHLIWKMDEISALAQGKVPVRKPIQDIELPKHVATCYGEELPLTKVDIHKDADKHSHIKKRKCAFCTSKFVSGPEENNHYCPSCLESGKAG